MYWWTWRHHSFSWDYRNVVIARYCCLIVFFFSPVLCRISTHSVFLSDKDLSPALQFCYRLFCYVYISLGLIHISQECVPVSHILVAKSTEAEHTVISIQKRCSVASSRCGWSDVEEKRSEENEGSQKTKLCFLFSKMKTERILSFSSRV